MNQAAGGAGVEILDRRAAMLVPEVGDLAAGRVLLRAYVEGDAALPLDLEAFPRATVRGTEPVDDDWQERWKDFFHATRVSDRFVVRPPWENLADPPGPGIIEIVVEPGMAFGTGTHETTRLCIRALDGRVEPGMSVLDVGCGSAILCVAAARLGARPIVGIDIDPGSIQVSRENLRANGVSGRVQVSTMPLAEIDGRWDVVVANILSSILVTLRKDLVARVAPGGRLLLSGILEREADEVAEAFEALGMVEEERTEEAAWACLVMR